jgi:hydrogenase maturation protease
MTLPAGGGTGRAGGARSGGQPVRRAALVVGLGSPDRGDDAVGAEVARAVAALALPGVEVTEHEDPTDLIERWSGHESVVVVDAVSAGVAVGSLRIMETGAGLDRLPESAWARTGRGGTHAFGLAAAVELARALRRLPPRVTLVGIEAGGFEHGAPLSPEVAAAVPSAVAAVVGLVGHRAAATRVIEKGTVDVPR